MPPWHKTLVTVGVAVKTEGSVTLTVTTKTQFWESVIVSEYTAAARWVKSCVVSPVFQRWVIGLVPPLTTKLIAPVESPWQSGFVEASVAEGPLGVVTLVVAVPEHPFASVTVTW